MSIRDVLARNFKKLRDANPALSTNAQLVKRGVLSNGTLGRIPNCQVDLGIDKLEPLAAIYGIEPWQLLHPEFEAGDAPKPMPAPPVSRYGHMAESIALLVDQVPESDASTKTQMLLAVSQIVHEWNLRQESKPPSGPILKKPTKPRRVKT